ncbi:fluoride efflux transporter FluC [Halomonadaceae bacterium KBTZ08]
MIGELAAVATGSALGGLCRFHLTAWIDRQAPTPFPLATLAVNILGTFLLGLLAGVVGSAVDQPIIACLAMTGFCGSVTTVSSWSLQTLTLARSGRLVAALLNLVITVAAGLGALMLGMTMTGATP